MNRQINTGDIFICNFGNQTGSMQGGIRPCVIVDNAMACAYSPCVHCVPLTTKLKTNPLHYIITKENCPELVANSIALCEQFTLIGKEQLVSYIGKIDKGDLIHIADLCKKNLPFEY